MLQAWGASTFRKPLAFWEPLAFRPGVMPETASGSPSTVEARGTCTRARTRGCASDGTKPPNSEFSARVRGSLFEDTHPPFLQYLVVSLSSGLPFTQPVARTRISSEFGRFVPNGTTCGGLQGGRGWRGSCRLSWTIDLKRQWPMRPLRPSRPMRPARPSRPMRPARRKLS